MNFTLIEQLNAIANGSDHAARMISESLSDNPHRVQIIESADGVLGILAAKLKSGKALSPAELDEYAQLYASLSLLAQDTVRQGYNIDLTTPIGKQKFANIVNKVGDDVHQTDNVKRVATVNGQSHYKQIQRDLEAFPTMDPTQQQVFINQINKLRLGYERVKNQLKSAPDAQPQAQPSMQPAAPQATAPAAI